jgi:hypothetical protein
MVTLRASTSPERVARRREILAALGASLADQEALLEYNHSQFDHSAFATSWPLPLADEPHLAAWRAYAEGVSGTDLLDRLSRRLVQLQFPVAEGVSQTATYRLATRQGIWPDPATAQPLPWNRPDLVRLELASTAVGAIPIVITVDRGDFESLVRACLYRNEPVAIPQSMGAVMVAGFNNWDRVKTHRQSWAAENGSDSGDLAWQQEFARLIPRKELYQDRFIILSSGPYSGVAGEELGLAATDWLALSLVIRREHECTHYFTRRCLGSMRQNLLDEILADFMGVTAAADRFEANWFLRFLGLEDFPTYRSGGRLENYMGQTPFSPSAFAVLTRLVEATARHLEQFDRACCRGRRSALERSVPLLALSTFCVEELASDEAGTQLHRRVDEFDRLASP